MKSSLFWNVISLGTEFLIGFVSLTLVSRLFDTEATGAWVLMLTILFLITKMREGMIQNALVKFSADVDSLLASTARVRSLSVLLVFELSIALLGFILATIFPNHLISPFIQWIGLVSFPQAMYRFGLNLLQAQLKNREMAISNSILFIGMMSSFGLLFLFNGTFNSLIFIYSLVFGVSSGLLFGIFLRKLKWTYNAESLPFAEFFHYIKHGFLRESIGTLSSRGYIFASAAFGGLATSASVGIASRYANLIYLPNSAYHGVVYPKACKQFNSTDRQSIMQFFSKALATEFVGFMMYAPILIVASTWFIPFLHGNAYQDASAFLAVLVLHGAFISPIGHAYGSVMHLLEKPEKVTQLIGLMSVLSISTTLGFGLLWGVWGSLLAPIFSDIVGLAVMHYQLKNLGLTPLTSSYAQILPSLKKMTLNFQFTS